MSVNIEVGVLSAKNLSVEEVIERWGFYYLRLLYRKGDPIVREWAKKHDIEDRFKGQTT